jgi:hypothetical protein
MESDYGKIKKLLKTHISSWTAEECYLYLSASEKSQAQLKEFGTPADAKAAVCQHLKALTAAAGSHPSAVELATASHVFTMMQYAAARAMPQALSFRPLRSNGCKALVEDMVAMFPALSAMQVASIPAPLMFNTTRPVETIPVTVIDPGIQAKAKEMSNLFRKKKDVQQQEPKPKSKPQEVKVTAEDDDDIQQQDLDTVSDESE